jgi:multimeric flavodoxin WrbA
MRILALQGSPNHDGLTARMAKQATAGAKAAGAETELLNLCDLKLGSCRQCDDGWGQCRREGTCIIDDDFEIVRGKMASADGIVISTPVYWGNLSEIFKAFLDRLRRCERAGPDEPKVEGRWVLGIAAAGGSGGGGPTCLVSMDHYYSHLGLRMFDYMFVTRRSADYMLNAARAAGETFVKYIEEQRQPSE